MKSQAPFAAESVDVAECPTPTPAQLRRWADNVDSGRQPATHVSLTTAQARALANDLEFPSADSKQQQPPPLGASWPEQGGIYAGLVRGIAGAPNYHLIVAEAAAEDLSWKKACTWAADLKLHGFADYALPDRREQRILFLQVQELFEADWYWSGTQSAADAAYAWCQTFDTGTQDGTHEHHELRARAVRRLPI
jgi:hypothetical protein